MNKKYNNKIKFLGIFIIITFISSFCIIFANTDGIEEYKKTDELTAEDIYDDFQKNYQETTHDDGSYLTKSVEWVDKENGEAIITLKGSQIAKGESTCLYVSTLCYAHGLTEEITEENILTLIENYDNVDFIAINNTSEAGIASTKRFTKKDTSATVRKYLTDIKAAGTEYPHYVCSIPVAIEKYLFGAKGDEHISKEGMINKPIAIYVSTDTIYAETELMEYSTKKYNNFLATEYAGRYFSMSQTSQQDANPTINIRYPANTSYPFNEQHMNLILGVLNPENWGDANIALSQESLNTWKGTTTESLMLPWTNKKYAAQYSYSKNFKEAGVKIISQATIKDVVADEFEITNVNAYNEAGEVLESQINNQAITVNDEKYTSGEEITVQIHIKLRPDYIEEYDNFTNTNNGVATFTSDFNNEQLTTESPKLMPTVSNYKVRYLDRYTNEPISAEKVAHNIAVNTEVLAAKEVIEISGYRYSHTDKNNIIVEMDEDKNIINLYYSKATKLKVNYIDQTNNNVLDTYSEDKYEGDTYTTESRDFDRYKLVEIPSDQNGVMGHDEKVVNYYYIYTSRLTVKYVDEQTGSYINPDENIDVEVYEGDPYTTDKKSFEGYGFTRSEGVLSGTVGRENIEVTYYYSRKSAGVDVIHKDQVTGEELVSPRIHEDGYIGDEYTAHEEKIQGYRLVKRPTAETVKMEADLITLTYEYRKVSNVVTRYVDENTGLDIDVSQNTTEEYMEGEEYTTQQKEFNGYKFTRSEGVLSGTVEREDIEVTYYYKKISGGVEVIYRDELHPDFEELAPREKYEGLEKDPYQTIKKEVPGYRFTKTSGAPVEGEMAVELQQVIYEYRKLSNVSVRYVDVNTGLDIDVSQNTIEEYMEGEEYTTQQKEFEGYRATGATQNTSGTMEREDIEVIYYYKKISAGVEGIYREELHPEHELYARFNQTGLEKDAYNVPSRLIEGYALTNTIGNPVGEMTVEKITVIYEYRKLVGVTERHIDTNTGKDIVTPERREYQEQTEYSTSSKEIPGYRLVVTPANAEGTVGQEDFEVVYEYKKISEGVETRFVDQVTGAEIETRVMQEGLEGEEYTTAPKVIEGYTQVGTPANAKGEFKEELTVVTYEYRKNAKLIVHHVDENTGREIIDPTETTYKEGDRYTTLPQSIEGYVVTKEPEQKEGVIGRENIEVTYYYKKGSAGLTVKYVDEQTGDLLDQKEYTGNENDVIQLEEKSFENYVLVLKPKKSEVVLTVEAQEEIYYYRRIVKLDIEGIVQGKDEVLYTSSQNGIEGDKYTTTPMDIPGYTLVVTPDNATGVYSRNSEKVVYEYSNKKAGRVVVKYVDEETGKTIEEVVINGFDGDKYETDKKEYEDYNFKRVEGDPRGEIKEGEKVVTYYYERKSGKVVVTYEDTEGNVLLQDEMNGKVKEHYKVEEKQIPGYEIVERPESTEGEYVEGTTYLKYVLERKKGKVKVNFKDEEGNEIYPSVEEEGYTGEEFYLQIPEKEGYYVDGDKEIRVRYEEGEIVIDVIYLKEEIEIPNTGDISPITVFTILALSILGIKYNLKNVIVNNK